MNKRLPSYQLFVKRTLAQRFSVFLAEINNIRTKNDVDAVHDMRVASRRFHAASLLFKDSVNQKILLRCERHIRKIRKSAGAMRDTDVQYLFVEHLHKRTPQKRLRAGLERIMLRLLQKRIKLGKMVSSSLGTFETSKTAETIKRILSVPTRSSAANYRRLSLKQRAGKEISAYLSRFLAFEQFVYQPTAAKELHTMRIAAKRLRYVLEIFSPMYRGKLKPFIRIMKNIQDALGEMHDCDVWGAAIPLFIEKERRRTLKFYGSTSTFSQIERGVVYLLDYARQQREKQYGIFVRIWKNTQRQRAWEKLTAILTTEK